MKAAKINVYYDGRLQPPGFKQSEVVLDAQYATSYLHPMTRIFSFVLKTGPGDRLTSLKFLNIVEVQMGVNVDFATFFAENNVDPVTISAEFKPLLPPDYEANYNPRALIREDPFIRNMAAVLQINPERIKITNIVPGNSRRRRVRMLLEMGWGREDAEELEGGYGEITGDRRFLSGATEGLDLGFEIAETDPCADVVCGVNGVCDKGICKCNDGYYTIGAYKYNTTIGGTNVTISVNASDPCSVNQTQWTKLFNSSSSSLDADAVVLVEEPLVVTSGPAIYNATNATNATVTSQDTFAELISVASSLTDSAETGNLDLGYEVTEMKVVVPPDVCGVPGGDGSTCLDACGVAMGDNSTCTDVCGVLNGDGLSCLVEETTYFVCNGFERQEIKLLPGSSAYISGMYRLVFNGESTAEMSLFTSTEDIESELSKLSTVGEVKVHALVGDNYTEYTTLNGTKNGYSGAYVLNLGLEFRATKMMGMARNYGELPLASVDASGLSNLGSSTVTRTCPSTVATGYTLEEQMITLTSADGSTALSSAMSGIFSLGFDTSSQKPWNISRYELRGCFASSN